MSLPVPRTTETLTVEGSLVKGPAGRVVKYYLSQWVLDGLAGDGVYIPTAAAETLDSDVYDVDTEDNENVSYTRYVSNPYDPGAESSNIPDLAASNLTASNNSDAPVDASTSHALNSTFSDTEVETALNALGTKINAVAAVVNLLIDVVVEKSTLDTQFDAYRAKINAIIAVLEAKNLTVAG